MKSEKEIKEAINDLFTEMVDSIEGCGAEDLEIVKTQVMAGITVMATLLSILGKEKIMEVN